MNPFNIENGPKIESGFSAPDSYFEGFEDRMMPRLPQQEVKVVSLFGKYRTVFYAAAAILVLALCIPVFDLMQKPSADTIDEETLEHYLAYESGISQYDLISVMDVSEIAEIESQSELPVSDEAIEEVLSESNIEYILTE